MVFSLTFFVSNGLYSVNYDPTLNDDGHINNFFSISSNEFKIIFPRKKYFYHWTKEYKAAHQELEHYHMIVVANNTNITECYNIQRKISTLKNITRCFFAPRYYTNNQYFHYLNDINGSKDDYYDAIERYYYYSKVDQKVDLSLRSFDGSRKLTELYPVKPFDSNQYRLNQKYKQKEINTEIILPPRCKFGKFTKTTSTEKNKLLII